jgi:hypothetical protein
LAPDLLAQFPEESAKPWTTQFILEELKSLSQFAKVLDTVIPAALENWLLHQEEWARVGIDRWLPKSKLPPAIAKHRYAVSPVSLTKDRSMIALPVLKLLA